MLDRVYKRYERPRISRNRLGSTRQKTSKFLTRPILTYYTYGQRLTCYKSIIDPNDASGAFTSEGQQSQDVFASQKFFTLYSLGLNVLQDIESRIPRLARQSLQKMDKNMKKTRTRNTFGVRPGIFEWSQRSSRNALGY
jgi:hypothetical protein